MSVRTFVLSVAATTVIAPFALIGPAAAVEGDPVKGEEVYAQCIGCHDFKENKVGPKHCGVVGRAAASVPDYNYSSAMQESEITWTEEELHEFLKSPFTYVSGTMMGFVGLYDEQERADVIAYIQKVSEDPAVCGE